MQALPVIAEYAPTILAVAGTAAQMYAADEQQNQQRAILNRQLERDDKASQQANQQVLQEGQRYTMPNRQQALQDAENKTYEQTQADLQGAGGSNIATAADNANQSEDFLKTKAARAIEEGTRLTAIAREAAKERAPGQLRMDDSLSMGNLTGNLQNLWGTTRNMAGANGLESQSLTTPAIGQLGKVASAVGMGMAASGYGQGADTGAGMSPPNPYANGPYRRTAGISFGAR